MVVAAFPIVKLGALAARQISKPLAKRIQIKAKTSPVLRTYLCLPLANFYHRLEVTFKMRSLNLKKPAKVSNLSETAAVELGAELLGELIIFTIAALTVTFEYRRQSKAKQIEAAQSETKWSNLVGRLRDLEMQMDTVNAQLRHFERTLHDIDSRTKDKNSKTTDKK
ncbi:putative OPA3-like protein CG13603 [Tetranychus urticae]|uniref:OPA3-like protein n=1 Tax=Tetranychus urticae TaxID=32264 RepID=T1KM78_TETUR|nr:putative OPA3-like protein CG13603 [Tetranychus urticae]